MIKANRKSILSLLVLGVMAAFAYRWLAMPRLRPHIGEGTFKNISWRFPWGAIGIPVSGYSITFPAFDLGAEYEHTFHLEQLPDLPQHLGIYLCIADPGQRLRDDAFRKRLDAEFSIDVQDEQGHSIGRMHEPVSRMWWAEPEGGGRLLRPLRTPWFILHSAIKRSL